MKHAALIALCAALSLCLACSSGSALALAVPPSPMPLAAADLCAASVGNESFVFIAGETFQYTPTTGKWNTILQSVGVSTAAAAVVRGQVVIVGGGGQEPLDNCTIFVPPTASSPAAMKQCTRMPTPRGFVAAATTMDMVYAIGGYAPDGWDIVESYDITTNSWQMDLPRLPTPRYGLSAVNVDGFIYAIGGSAWHLPAVATVEYFNPVTIKWGTKASMPIAAAYFAATVTNHKVYVFGGNDGTTNIAAVQVYTPATDSWIQATPLPAPLRSHEAAVTVSGYMLIVGGITGKNLESHPINTAEVYYPVSE